jgi:hypothetical protein
VNATYHEGRISAERERAIVGTLRNLSNALWILQKFAQQSNLSRDANLTPLWTDYESTNGF